MDTLPLSWLRSARLENDQAARIMAMTRDFDARIGGLKEKAAYTPQQIADRDRAVERAIRDGKTGREVAAAIPDSAELTYDQKAARLELVRLRSRHGHDVNRLLGDNQKAEIRRQFEDSDHFNGYIIVRVTSSLQPAHDDMQSLKDLAAKSNLRDLVRVLDRYKLAKSSRLVERSLHVGKTGSRGNSPDSAHSRLQRYWRIDARHHSGSLEEICNQLSSLREIEVAYRDRDLNDASVHPEDDPHFGRQDYLGPEPFGINARFAWNYAAGENVTLTDIERGWLPDHEDYASKQPTLVYGENCFGIDDCTGAHGAAVLGVTVADDNNLGIVGVAPRIGCILLASHVGGFQGPEANLAAAITTSANAMAPGDVLLLEVEANHEPVESLAGVFDAIRDTVDRGIIVVEAAGNGGRRLNLPEDLDSGAIIVAAATFGPPHTCHGRSNFGPRVDCFAQGSDIMTCGCGVSQICDGDLNRRYTIDFGKTSGASAIIAGAAVLLQSVYKSFKNGEVLTPDKMRQWLADEETATHAVGVKRIGVMPDLKRIIEKRLLN